MPPRDVPPPVDGYQPVPVDVARQIGQTFAKNQVIIVAIDRVYGKLHRTTWGQEIEDKQIAAHWGELFALAMAPDAQVREVHEDWRRRTEAQWAVESDRLHQRIAELERAVQRPGLAPSSYRGRYEYVRELLTTIEIDHDSLGCLFCDAGWEDLRDGDDRPRRGHASDCAWCKAVTADFFVAGCEPWTDHG